jgi:hypothetical protein
MLQPMRIAPAIKVVERSTPVETPKPTAAGFQSYPQSLAALPPEVRIIFSGRVGTKDGSSEGEVLGADDGKELGAEEGQEEGSELGVDEGTELGVEEGNELGTEEGEELGSVDETREGTLDGK